MLQSQILSKIFCNNKMVETESWFEKSTGTSWSVDVSFAGDLVLTSETDLNNDDLSSDQQSTSAKAGSPFDAKMARMAMRRGPAQQGSWRSNSSAGSATFSPELGGRTMSLEESSSSDENPLTRRRSSALHSLVGSRRCSGLQGQSSIASDSGDIAFSGFGRRRSSGMSDISQRSGTSSSSSSGKRSSTDYSSEMEEYFDNFQRSSIKTSVIEEESGAAMNLEQEVGASGGCVVVSHVEKATYDFTQNTQMAGVPKPSRRFVMEQPTNVARPQPIRASENLGLGNHSGLDHFVDNLMNEVAQESKNEIEELVRDRQIASRAVRTTEFRTTEFRTTEFCTTEFSEETSDSLKPFQIERMDRRFDTVPQDLDSTLENLPGRDGGNSSTFLENLNSYVDRLMETIIQDVILVVCESLASSQSSRSSRNLAAFENATSKDRRTRKRAQYRKPNSDRLNDFAADFVTEIFSEAVEIYMDFKADESTLASADEARTMRLTSAVGDAVRAWDAPDQSTNVKRFLQQKRISRKHSSSLSCDDAGSSSSRRNSSGFKDPVLSDFEDELVRSSVSSPGTIMFTSERMDMPPYSVRMSRRASEPVHNTRDQDGGPTVDDRGSLTVQEQVAQWFEGETNNDAPSRAPTIHDPFALSMIIEAFRSALEDIMGVTVLTTETDRPKSVGLVDVGGTWSLEAYASNLSGRILNDGIQEALKILLNNNERVDLEVHQLEALATNFANQVIGQAVEIVTGGNINIATGLFHFKSFNVFFEV